MPDLLAGRKALVTGAAGGIGAATVERFRAEGAAVVGADLAGSDVVCDVADESAVAAAFDAAEERLGGLDLVVANAGVLHVSPFADEPLAEFRRVLDVNTVGVFLCLREAARRLAPRGAGTILATASQAGRHGYAGLATYCASKFAVVGLVEALARELAPAGVRVACVAPALVATTMQDELATGYAEIRGRTFEQVRRGMLSSVPVGRMADPDEVARVFAFLASDLASYVSGVTIPIDAGEGT
jgi:NAD(P)-dependent dehydrogenase (short-subunit alcohol dehydrogenase family)